MELRSGKRLKTLETPGRREFMMATTARVINGNFQHPMMNHLILDNVFRFCTPSDRASCRLVCQYWYRACLPVWLENGSPIKLSFVKPYNGGMVMKCTDDWNDGFEHAKEDEHYISDFLQEFHQDSQTLGIPSPRGIIVGLQRYRKFDVDFRHRLDIGSPSSRPRLNTFWAACGEWMTQLRFKAESFTNENPVNLVEHILSCKQMPNLEWLNFHIWLNDKVIFPSLKCFEGEHKKLKCFEFDGRLELSEETWTHFLSRYPNLEKIHFRDRSEEHPQVSKILTSIKELRGNDPSKLQKLKSLSWIDLLDFEQVYPPANVVFESLHGAQLELDCLGAHFAKNESEARIHKILKLVSKTLASLQICHSRPLEKSPFAVGSMTQLKALVIHGPVFRNLLFLKDLPNLRSLRIYSNRIITLDTDPNGTDMMTSCRDDVVVFPSISKFALRSGTLGREELAKVSSWMPNLTHLEARVRDFPAVCEFFPKLEHLSLAARSCELGDKDIAGVVVNRRGKHIMNPQPNLTNLQRLRTMKITARWNPKYKITKLSVTEGFLKLVRLETLDMNVWGNVQRPLEFIEFKSLIEERLPFARITSTCSNQLHEIFE